MLIEAGLLSGGIAVVASAVGGVGLAFAIHGAPWRSWLLDGERQWVWFTSMAVLLVVWAMKAGITPGLSVRFLLVTALTLMHGWRLAVVAAALVLAVLSAVGAAEWSSYGANLLCTALIPALFTARLHELVHERLPHNYFIYFFVTAFLGAAVAFNVAGLARFALMALSGSLDTARIGAEYFAILPFMSFGEAVANGMIIGMAVVYRPAWVMSFDDRLYLYRQ
ncbi:MAG TPA: energy-coupling factor ABC transporter permease [Steroidobacteraceae bacterium]|nr:energy-coupling factor ABC transporter permease [Steroidobacteraceae bacterium]